MTDGGNRGQAPGAPPTTGGALGTGLLITGCVVGALILLWLLTNLITGQLSAGGLIFGLIILALLAGPILASGWYLRRRGASERAEADVFAARRAVLDNDRVVRRELARELGQRTSGMLQAADALPAPQAATLRQVAGRLQDVLQDVQAPGYDSTTWLEQTAARLDDRKLEQLRRYDDLVLEEVQRLEPLTAAVGGDAAAPQRLAENADLLAQHVREREALLGRARRGSGLAPQEILAAGARPRRRLTTPLELRLEDAVSYQLDDYVVRGIITYFAGAREWRVYQLHDGKQERWLDVRGEGADVSWYELRPGALPAGDPAAAAGATLTLDGVTYQPTEGGSASVGVESAAGRQDGVFVEYQHYRAAGAPGAQRLGVERWPDGMRVLVGEGITRDDLELWTKPATTE